MVFFLTTVKPDSYQKSKKTPFTISWLSLGYKKADFTDNVCNQKNPLFNSAWAQFTELVFTNRFTHCCTGSQRWRPKQNDGDDGNDVLHVIL